MNILSHKEYSDMKYNFLNEFKNWHVETSPMDKDGKYVKTYICDNGNIITEVNRPVYENVNVTVKGVTIPMTVKLFESEMFSNKFQSVYTYEKY